MTDKKKIVIVIVIVIVLICVGLVILFVNNSDDTNGKSDISLQNAAEDQETMLESSNDFINAFFNYNSQTLRNGKWKKSISSFVDNDVIKQYTDNLLYEMLYDIEWQLSHMVNDDTVSEVISINNIETIRDIDDYSVSALLTLRTNGAGEVDSPYFNLIQREQTLCTIDFTSENMIYFIQCRVMNIISNESNYGNV